MDARLTFENHVGYLSRDKDWSLIWKKKSCFSFRSCKINVQCTVLSTFDYWDIDDMCLFLYPPWSFWILCIRVSTDLPDYMVILFLLTLPLIWESRAVLPASAALYGVIVCDYSCTCFLFVFFKLVIMDRVSFNMWLSPFIYRCASFLRKKPSISLRSCNLMKDCINLSGFHGDKKPYCLTRNKYSSTSTFNRAVQFLI